MYHDKEVSTAGLDILTIVKQPDWYIRAVKRTITSLRGGYSEASKWIGVTEHSLYNRLRPIGDQVFPIGWSEALQSAGGTHFIAHAVSKASGGVFVPMPPIPSEIENADINQRLLEAIELISLYSMQVRTAIEDGILDHHEQEAIDAELYRVISKLQEHCALVYRIFCVPE